MSQLRVILQESLDRERETMTILALLREKMDGVDSIRRERGRGRSLKERLGLKSMGCCGATWGFRPNTINLSDSEGEEQQQRHLNQERSTSSAQNQPDNETVPVCMNRIPLISSGMNLAAALAAERHLRSADGANPAGPTVINNDHNVGPTGTKRGTPLRVSLMRLLAETEGRDGEEKAGNDSMCCVCMGRKKGAAFIPCGHTFCRVCSREMWLNRGSCPLCNRSILEILDIF